MNMHSKVIQFAHGVLVFNCIHAHNIMARAAPPALGEPIAAGHILLLGQNELPHAQAECYGKSDTLGLSFIVSVIIDLNRPIYIVTLGETPCLWIGDPSCVQMFRHSQKITPTFSWDAYGAPARVQWGPDVGAFFDNLPPDSFVSRSDLRFLLSHH